MKGLVAFFLVALSLAYASDPLHTKEVVNLETYQTDHWAVELAPGANAQEIAERHGHNVVGKLSSLPGVFIFEKKSDTVHGVTHPHHDESPEITWFENQVARFQSKRDHIIADPSYTNQWHLQNSSLIHVNIQKAWELGYQGQGIVVAIVDDGLEHTHPDLNANYNPASSWDFNYGDDDPYPETSGDAHGTSAAGVATARDNSVCGVGTAHRAKVAGIRLISKASTDALEAAALSYKRDENHIYSNSWGPFDDAKRLEGPGRLASAALEQGVFQGRQGNGSIFVWAGGNGRASGDNCNYDGWANSRYTISVAAVNRGGEQSWYSESCSMILISAPSSGLAGGGNAIVTTDLMGNRGNDRGDCTSTFGGTSAAAPLVAGIVALVLQRNPGLGWRDVQGVLIDSAAPVAQADADWQVNGGGKRVNHKYGFGLIDASAAVDLAGTWENFGPQVTESITVEDSHEIPVSSFYSSFATTTSNFTVEHVMVTVTLSHISRGDLIIKLVSPAGTVSVLAEQHRDTAANINGWTFGSIFQWGEESAGKWTLMVSDGKTRDSSVGHLVSWTLNVYGH